MMHSEVKIRRLLDFIKYKASDKAKCLLQNMDNIYDLKIDSGLSLLHYSVKHSNATMVQHFIEQGFDVNTKDRCGRTPLFLAIQNQELLIIELLLKNNADTYIIDSNGKTALDVVVRNRLIEAGIFSERHDYPLHYLIFETFIDKINEDFLTKYAKVMLFLLNAQNLTKFALVVFGNVGLSEFILENCYSIGYHEPKHNFTALHLAITQEKRETVKFLIEHRADICALDKRGLSPFYYYTGNFEHKDEQSEVLKCLLKSKPSLTYVNQNKYRIFERGVYHLLQEGNKETVKTVLQRVRGVTSLIIDSGKSIQQILFENENTGVLDLFMELDIELNINGRIPGKESFLKFAIDSGCIRKVEFVLEQRADVNIKLSNLESVLYYVCSEYFRAVPKRQEHLMKIVKMLLEYGSEIQGVSMHERSVINLCFHYKNSYLADLIVDHMALLEVFKPSVLKEFSRQELALYPTLKTRFNDCIKNITKMKFTKVHGNVTLFDLLNESHENIVAHARIQEFLVGFNLAIDKLDLDCYYRNILLRKISKAMEKLRLIENAAVAFGTLSGICSVGYSIIVYKIIHQLNDDDMKKLCYVAMSST